MSGTSTPIRLSSDFTCPGLRRSTSTPTGAWRSTSASRRARCSAASASVRGRWPMNPAMIPSATARSIGSPSTDISDAQELGRRLRARRGRDPRPITELAEARLLEHCDPRRQLRPPPQPFRSRTPTSVQPLRPEVPVRTDRIVRIAVAAPGVAEQVRRRGRRDRVQRQMLELRPHASGIGPPSTEEEPMHPGEVPARRDPHPGPDKRRRGVVRPQHPPGSERLLHEPDHHRRILDAASDRHLAHRRGHSEAHPRRNGQADKVTAHDPSPAQLLDHVRARLSHEPTLPPLGPPGAPTGSSSRGCQLKSGWT